MTTPITPAIQSLLETDLYKFTMWQALRHQFSGCSAEYRFVCRNDTQYPLADLAEELNSHLDHLCTLRFTEDELSYLAGLRYIKPDFVEFLRLFQLNREFITVKRDRASLSIVAKGPQIYIMAFEIYVLAMVNELYFRRITLESLDVGRQRLHEKIGLLRTELSNSSYRHPFEFSDFGLRRRYSRDWHDEVVRTLKDEIPEYFKGTSNVYLAKKYDLVPIGTMAHEYLQTFQAGAVQLRYFQVQALESWVQEYRGDLGVALTDTVGMDAFLEDFDLYFAKLFDGLRHDSGEPVLWAEKALAHYGKLRIDANTKRLTFSDGLTLPLAVSLYRRFADRTQLGFGIGTNLTNDVGLKPLSIVMKLVRCNSQPVAKLSDSPGKTLCDDDTFLAYLRQVFNKSESA